MKFLSFSLVGVHLFPWYSFCCSKVIILCFSSQCSNSQEVWCKLLWQMPSWPVQLTLLYNYWLNQQSVFCNQSWCHKLGFITFNSQIDVLTVLPKTGSVFISACGCLLPKTVGEICTVNVHLFIQHQADVYWALSVCQALFLVVGFNVHKHFGFCIFVSKEC